MAEGSLRETLDEFAGKGNWRVNAGDGAFYGPKIDIKVQCSLCSILRRRGDGGGRGRGGPRPLCFSMAWQGVSEGGRARFLVKGAGTCAGAHARKGADRWQAGPVADGCTSGEKRGRAKQRLALEAAASAVQAGLLVCPAALNRPDALRTRRGGWRGALLRLLFPRKLDCLITERDAPHIMLLLLLLSLLLRLFAEGVRCDGAGPPVRHRAAGLPAAHPIQPQVRR